AACTAGVAFAVPQFLVSNFHGPWLVDIVAAVASMAALAVLLQYWKPKENWNSTETNPTAPAAGAVFLGATADPCPEGNRASGSDQSLPSSGNAGFKALGRDQKVAGIIHTRSEITRAWVPWMLLSLLVFLWGIPQVKKFFNDVSAPKFRVAGLHEVVMRAPPVVPPATPEKPSKPEEAVFTLNWLSATGTGILVSGILAGLLM